MLRVSFAGRHAKKPSTGYRRPSKVKGATEYEIIKLRSVTTSALTTTVIGSLKDDDMLGSRRG